MSIVLGNITIVASADGKTDWKLLEPKDVPQWLQNPDVLGQMVDGMLAHRESEPESPWYGAVLLPTRAANDEETEANAIQPAPVHLLRAPEPDVIGRMVEAGGIPLPDPLGGDAA